MKYIKFHVEALPVHNNQDKTCHVQDVSERKIRFTSTHAPKHLFNKIEDIATEMGLQAHKGPGKVSTLTSSKDSLMTK